VGSFCLKFWVGGRRFRQRKEVSRSLEQEGGKVVGEHSVNGGTYGGARRWNLPGDWRRGGGGMLGGKDREGLKLMGGEEGRGSSCGTWGGRVCVYFEGEVLKRGEGIGEDGISTASGGQ